MAINCPQHNMELNRRSFLLAAAAVPLYAGPPVTFGNEDIKLLDAICNQIIPADDTPGASAAGVVYYIDKQLAGPLKRFRPTYDKGLAEFRAKGYLAMSFEQQTTFLKSIEKGELAGFFSTVVEHTMQGFYGSPEHGGNLDEASWKMLGITGVMGGHKH